MKDGSIIRERPKKKNRMQAKLILFLLLVLGLLASVPSYYLFSSQRDDFTLRSYTYAVVESRTFRRGLNIRGTVEPQEISMVKSPLSGDLTQVKVAPGSRVVTGELLAVVVSLELEKEIGSLEESMIEVERRVQELEVKREISVKREELEIHLLHDRYRDALADLELKERLFELGSISSRELEEAKTTLKSVQVEKENTSREHILNQESYELERKALEQELLTAQKDLSSLLERLEESRIKAPMDGLVMEVLQEENRSIHRGDELFQIMDIDSSVVVLSISEGDLSRIKENQEASIQVADTYVKGHISFISPQTKRDQDGPVVEVHLSLDEIPPNLRAFSTAVVEFELTRRESIPYLPRGDYLTSGEYNFVYVIDGDEATRETVTFGQHEGTFIEIESGLEIGDVVITSSYEVFKDRRRIRINQEGGRPH